MFKNIIFDWSGVVKDSFEAHLWIVNKMFERAGVEKISSEELKKDWVQPYMIFYNKYIPNFTKEEQDKIWTKTMLSKDVPESHEYPGMADLIKKLKEDKRFLAVLSSDPPKMILPEIEKFGLEDIFDYKVIEVHDKTEGAKEIIKNNNLDINETVFIGDSNHEIEVGKEVGIKTIAVTWGFSTEENLKSVNPDYLVHNVKELEEILLK
ncbi:MAG: HAD family hydrolase [Candidatus Staskawiczbacteria bacterium]|nr:HAD family hydrolase [Candidatus Staskawiczbacteria bacterium]